VAKISDTDPWLLPIRSQVIELPQDVEEAIRRLNTLIARPGTKTSEALPFRGGVDGGQIQLTVRIPTSGVASGLMQHERALVVVHGEISKRNGGSTLRLVMRQPLPAFLLLFIVWIGFIYSMFHGTSPALLMTPIMGHAILIFFFRMASRQRVLDPLSKALGVPL
jgi:hypothetical protein